MGLTLIWIFCIFLIENDQWGVTKGECVYNIERGNILIPPQYTNKNN